MIRINIIKLPCLLLFKTNRRVLNWWHISKKLFWYLIDKFKITDDKVHSKVSLFDLQVNFIFEWKTKSWLFSDSSNKHTNTYRYPKMFKFTKNPVVYIWDVVLVCAWSFCPGIDSQRRVTEKLFRSVRTT